MNNNIWNSRIGEEFGELTLVRYLGNSKALFKCSCGEETVKYYQSVKRGEIISCGHIKRNKELRGLEGSTYNSLTALKYVGKRDGKTYYLFKCKCGNEVERNMYQVKSGLFKSCGCAKYKDCNYGRHNLSRTRLYNIHSGMINRCYNENVKTYKYYGAKGIKVCDEWLGGDEGLFNFIEWANNNGYSDDLSIDRMDVNGNYEPSNCRWADFKTQMDNKTNRLYYTYNNETKTLSDWCDILNLKYNPVWKRISIYGYDFEKAITYNKHKIMK